MATWKVPYSRGLIRFDRIGSLCFASGNVKFDGSGDQNYVAAQETIPQGYRPVTGNTAIAVFGGYKAKFDELKAKYPQARILYALQCMFRSAATEAKPVMTGLPAGTIMTNNFTALQSSERILFTETTLGVPVIDATDEVWALGSGLTISDMIHPTAEGAVKLGQILGRHIKQAIQQ